MPNPSYSKYLLHHLHEAILTLVNFMLLLLPGAHVASTPGNSWKEALDEKESLLIILIFRYRSWHPDDA